MTGGFDGRIRNEDASEAVMLVHGFLQRPEGFDMLADRLVEEGYAVATPVLPGHDTSPHALRRVSRRDWYEYVDDWAAYLAGRYDRVVIGGHSLGAVLTLRASYSADVDGVLLLAPSFRFRFDRWWLRWLLSSLLYVPALPWTNWIAEGLHEGSPESSGYSWFPTGALDEVMQCQQEMMELTEPVPVPGLVLHSRRDVFSDPLAALEKGRELGMTVLFYADGGHLVPLSADPEEFLADVGAFLDDCFEG